MKIENARYKQIPFIWGAATYPIKAGTPVGFGGVCNDGSAVGIVPQTIAKRPIGGLMTLLVGGDVDLAEVEASYGAALNAEAKKAMGGIRFYGADGTPEPDRLTSGDITPYILPAATKTALGGVLMVDTIADIEGEADVEKCAAKISAILTAMQNAGIMEK